MKRSGIITLLTDFGTADHYVAMVKGVILSINPDARIVDISHHIRTGSIFQAAGLIRETFPFFPKGSVHMAVVDPGVGSERRCIALEAGGHLFVGPDNGVFWPVMADNREARIVNLNENCYFLPSVTHTFHGREVFAPVAAHLSMGEDLGKMGQIVEDPVGLDLPVPHMEDNFLYGQVMRVDNFGNLITNIGRKELEGFLETAEPIVSIGDLEVKKFGRIYSEVEEGELLALINSSDVLEIAVNMGRASKFIGLESNEIVGAGVKVGRHI